MQASKRQQDCVSVSTYSGADYEATKLYGQYSSQQLQAGRIPVVIGGEAAPGIVANTATLGTFGTAQGIYAYSQTGDAKQWRQAATGQLMIATGALGVDAVMTPAHLLPTWSESTEVLKCPSCHRLWIFWDGMGQPPTEYQCLGVDEREP